jgi:hypothetical protein
MRYLKTIQDFIKESNQISSSELRHIHMFSVGETGDSNDENEEIEKNDNEDNQEENKKSE